MNPIHQGVKIITLVIITSKIFEGHRYSQITAKVILLHALATRKSTQKPVESNTSLGNLTHNKDERIQLLDNKATAR